MTFFGRKKKRDAADIRLEIESLQQELKSLAESVENEAGEAEPSVSDADIAVNTTETVDNSSSSALFATLSHELRTPLNGVLGMAQLLRGEVENEKLETLESCAQHMLSVLHTLVNLSKIQNQWGHLPEHMEWVNVHDLMEQIKKNIGRRAMTRCLKVQVEHQDKKFRLRGDYDHLVHIIETALLGSLECTDINSGATTETLNIKWKVSGHNVEIVIDNPFEIMPPNRGYRIFQVTEQTTGNNHERVRMEFLYWAVSSSLLEHYEGAMVATKTGETIGVRTTLGFRMESMRSTPTNERPVGGLSLEKSGSANSLLALPFCMNILVVEDDAINRDLMTLLLERVGQKCELALDGQAAIDLLAGGVTFDLILMDIDMPVLDGMMASRAIRAGEGGPKSAETPIVAVTAFNTLSDQSKFRKAGMNYFLSKPVSLNDLRSILLDVTNS